MACSSGGANPAGKDSDDASWSAAAESAQQYGVFCTAKLLLQRSRENRPTSASQF
jgi:hypothetical protein